MKGTTLLLTLISLTTCTTLLGQNEKNIWYFGDKTGLNFNTVPPTPLVDGQMRAFEGCATISDTAGNLLFYTNGGPLTDYGYSGGIWNKNHTLMPNGVLADTSGCTSAAISSVIIPNPANEDQYYVFTVNCHENNLIDGVRYSIVDMSLDGGLGDVSLRDIQVLPNAVETVTAIKHGNTCDYWIIAHENNTTNFHSILVSDAGVNDSVISNIGNLAPIAYTQIAVNASGSRIAVGNYLTGVTLFNFDIFTGIISNPIYLEVQAIGLAFSESGNYLYCNDRAQPYPMWQFDLTASNILASKTFLGDCNEWNNLGQMLLAPNGKIYITEPSKHTLGVINSPEAIGMASDYVPSGFYLSYKYNLNGLPNFANSYSTCSDLSVAEKQNDVIEVYPNPFNKDIHLRNCPESAEVRMFTADLKEIFVKRLGNNLIFDQKLAPGMYFIQVQMAEKLTMHKILCE